MWFIRGHSHDVWPGGPMAYLDAALVLSAPRAFSPQLLNGWTALFQEIINYLCPIYRDSVSPAFKTCSEKAE